MNALNVVIVLLLGLFVGALLVAAYATGRVHERRSIAGKPQELYREPRRQLREIARPHSPILNLLTLFLFSALPLCAQTNRLAEIRTASGKALQSVLVEERTGDLARLRYIEGATRAKATTFRALLDPVSAELVFGPTNAVTNLTIRATAAEVARWERDTLPLLGRTADRGATRNTHRGVRR